jgi:hypothetical protein
MSVSSVSTVINEQPSAPSRKIISIDVGIARLAFCLFSKESDSQEFTIRKWSIVNLTKTSDEVLTCGQCSAVAKYEKNGKKFCAKHQKTHSGLLPCADTTPAKIKKLKLDGLHSLATKYFIPLPKEGTPKKAELVEIISKFIKEHTFEEIKKTNASELDLNVIGRNIKDNFNALFEDDFDTITDVVIENQLSPMAIRMKTIQGMISQYFIMKNDNIHIRFVNATNKLKGVFEEVENQIAIKEPEDYKERKNLGIHICKEIINQQPKYSTTKWCAFINEKKKKDGVADLSDCFLQGLWYIETECKKHK